MWCLTLLLLFGCSSGPSEKEKPLWLQDRTDEHGVLPYGRGLPDKAECNGALAEGVIGANTTVIDHPLAAFWVDPE